MFQQMNLNLLTKYLQLALLLQDRLLIKLIIIPVVVGGDNYGAEKVREKNPQKSALSLDERPWHHVRDVFCPDQQYTQP